MTGCLTGTFIKGECEQRFEEIPHIRCDKLQPTLKSSAASSAHGISWRVVPLVVRSTAQQKIERGVSSDWQNTWEAKGRMARIEE